MLDAVGTVTTNVPGPPAALYAAGREMLEYLPFVPLGPGLRIAVAILSYNGRVAFGITGDFDTSTDVDIDVVARGIEAEIGRPLALASPSCPDVVIDLSEANIASAGQKAGAARKSRMSGTFAPRPHAG